ncbi:O-methyltransferase [Parasegetibacter sp. NRK P23]|uniref:O-methyltransferase n=1 Tax=Parasegetibacter sp. NRK P23 TaxID=2942999 RepID=UPI002043DE0F|nr:O-methyltransferase [Parasegetibacter sp. NRK P23]MCM5529370.1 O-methyltransferase [Parasegetibacter sp. NRK P23]
MDIVSPEITAYADRFTSADDPLREMLLKDTLENHPHAHMVSGRQQGRFLEMVSRMLQPRRILEIGTFTGYSALCLAEGLPPDGRLHTLELRTEDAQKAQSYFNRSPHASRIILHTGNALEVLPELEEVWDLVFLDADKTAYLAYYEMVVERIRPGGILLADNVLFHGQVLEEPIKGKNAKAVHAFNEAVANDPRVETVLLTIRDGLLMVRRK